MPALKVLARLGLSALVFTAHGIMLYGLEIQVKRMSLDRMAVMEIFNLIGAYIYAARVGDLASPEVPCPILTCNRIGSSLQILHVMVVLADLMHFDGLLSAFDSLPSKNPRLRPEIHKGFETPSVSNFASE